MSSKPPRIVPLDPEQLSEEQIAILGDRNDPRGELNFFKVLVQHPQLFGSYTPFAMQLGTRTILPVRDKEVIILRTSALCHETYELAHHLYIAREAGMTDAEIAAAQAGGEGLSPFEQLLIRAVEDLVGNYCISDEIWAALAEHYTTQQLIELVFMVANYTLLAMVNNSLDIRPEEEVEETWKPVQAGS